MPTERENVELVLNEVEGLNVLHVVRGLLLHQSAGVSLLFASPVCNAIHTRCFAAAASAACADRGESCDSTNALETC